MQRLLDVHIFTQKGGGRLNQVCAWVGVQGGGGNKL